MYQSRFSFPWCTLGTHDMLKLPFETATVAEWWSTLQYLQFLWRSLKWWLKEKTDGFIGQLLSIASQKLYLLLFIYLVFFYSVFPWFVSVSANRRFGRRHLFISHKSKLQIIPLLLRLVKSGFLIVHGPSLVTLWLASYGEFIIIYSKGVIGTSNFYYNCMKL